MTNVRVVGILAVLAATTVFSGEAGPGTIAHDQRTQTPATTDPVLQRAADYVRSYQAALTSVVATEEYAQQVAARYPPDPRLPTTRVLESDVFFLYLEGYDWMTIREVRSVDGTEIPRERSALEDLTHRPPREVAVQFKRDNSQFNVGTDVPQFQ